MAKIDEQLANIDAMLKQILSQTSADTAEDMSESESEGKGNGSCPYCGCNGDHEGEDTSAPGPKMGGKMVVMISKKKGGPAGNALPPILKDLLKTMTK